MSIFSKIIDNYESAKVDHYFKPESRVKDYAFRIVNPESTIHGLQIFIDQEMEEGGEVKVVKRPKRFLPENRKVAATWGDKVQDFIALHIWLNEAKDCFIYTITQSGVIKALFEIIKQVGEENLAKVTFLLNKQGQGFQDTKYVLSVAKDADGEVLLSELPAEAVERAKNNPVNMNALFFNERPWDNDTEYDLKELDQSPKPCPPQLAKIVSAPSFSRKRGGVNV